MLNKPEFYIWFLLPSALAGFVVFKSVLQSVLRKSIFDWFLSISIFALIALAEVILYRIFIMGAYPTFLAHLMIMVAAILLIVQLRFVGTLSKRNER